MSQWRRIALEEVPSCKRGIEEAGGAGEVWIELWHEFFSAYSKPGESEKMQQIYRFALRCSKGDKSNPLTLAVSHFFYYIIGQFVIGNSHVRLDLPKRMSSGDFEYWLGSVEHEFPKETLNDAKRAFNAAKHKIGQ